MGRIVSDNTGLQRYELHIDGELAAFADYTLDSGLISFTHTEALPEFTGTGAAKQLVAEMLDDAHGRALAVLPHCTYVASTIRKNPAVYLDLVPVDRRAEFDLPT
jgi:predicted GNAT family acetyltransferase